MKKRGGRKQEEEEDVVVETVSDASEEEEEKPQPRKAKGKKSSARKDPAEEEKPGGLNYTAIAIMAMFAIPMLIAGILQGIDFFYPEAAKTRKVRERVVRCYEAANPSKVSEVDSFIEKYQGREHILFAKLRNKYEKFPECQ